MRILNLLCCQFSAVLVLSFCIVTVSPLSAQESILTPQTPSASENEPAPQAVSAAQTVTSLEAAPAVEAVLAQDVLLSSEFVKKAWELSGKNDLAGIQALVDECLKIYGPRAKDQQATLDNFPVRGKEEEYQVLNDVATVLFVRAEALMNNGRSEEAIPAFQKLIDDFKWAQSWDPSRGAFWSIAEKSQASIDVMLGNVQEKPDEEIPPSLRSFPPNINPGKEKVINYRKYGEFTGVGTKDYKYVVHKPKELAAAVGHGLYPNNLAVFKLPEYLAAKESGRLNGNHWDFIRTSDLEAAYWKWLNAPEPVGIRLFYLGIIFEKAKMYHEAIKAYHALIVHFPNTVAWTYWQTPWYPAQAAVSKIQHIIRTHPDLNLMTQWMKIEVVNGFDNDVSNDVVITWPGMIKEKSNVDRLKEKLNLAKDRSKLGDPVETLGRGKVRLVKYENGHWQMLVNGKPFIIKGITYAPTKVGQSPDKNTLVSWMKMDSNKNGVLDGPYEAWVDHNRNNSQDQNELSIGDFKLMKDMGVNTIREYHQPFKPDKDVLRKMHKEFGFKVIMGDFLGKYTHGSGATWFEGTDYANPVHRKNMMNSVREMVMEFKDEPYILFWLLGNENNYGVASNADKNPVAYFQFVNEVAKMIHEIDPDHPVAVCNGDTLYLDIFAKNAPEVDIFGANVYRGDYGFGSFWEQVSGATGKPAFITEYGAPAFVKHLSLEEGETEQVNYHRGNWLDIQANFAGNAEGVGNSLGGVVFEWLDEWWKNYEPYYHDRKSDAVGPFAGGYYFEEWFGLMAQGNGRHSPFLRQPRKVYEAYKEMWRSQP